MQGSVLPLVLELRRDAGEGGRVEVAQEEGLFVLDRGLETEELVGLTVGELAVYDEDGVAWGGGSRERWSEF